MLRLTVTAMTAGSVEFKVEGWVAGAGVGILAREGARHLRPGNTLVLNLQGVRFADVEGARLLREWVAAGVVLQSPSSFIRELLREQGPEDRAASSAPPEGNAGASVQGRCPAPTGPVIHPIPGRDP
jgi:hypothetical protein